MDQELLRSVDSFVRENRDNILRDIARLVAVNSVAAEPEEDAPNGRGAADALQVAFDICGELGLRTHNCENILGYAQIGESVDYLGTITHLDVVPFGEGWTGDPLVMRERDGYIIGRGVMDDKGASVLCLYMLKYLQEHVPLRYSVRALLGLSEETGMSDLEYYLAHYAPPLFCLSPDSNYPVCVGEKGLYGATIRAARRCERVKAIRGGVASNVVPAKCEAWVEAERLSGTESVSAEYGDGLWHLTAHGVSGHASKPEGTVNAIGVMAHYLMDNGVVSGAERALLEKLCLLYDAPDGSALGIAADDGSFTPLTVVGGVIGMDDGYITQSVDSRFPTNTDAERITDALRAAFGELAEISPERDVAPFFVPAGSLAVRCCMDAYETVTGEKAGTYTTGGATYARMFPSAAAFGPEHPERSAPDFAGPIHGADEAACIDDLMETLKIYILAFTELLKLDYQ